MTTPPQPQRQLHTLPPAKPGAPPAAAVPSRRRPGGLAPPATLSAPSPGHITWPHHDPGAGIKLAPGPDRGIPPVRFPQGDLEWILKISNAPADPIPMPPGGIGGLVESGQMVLFGGSVVNTATTVTTLTLYDGMDIKGGQAGQFTIPASSNLQITLPRAGVLLEIGLFAQVSGGFATGTLYVAHLWKYPFTPPGE